MESTQNLQLTLTIGEINQILEALGEKKYADVYRLIGKIQQQADAQLSEAGDTPLAPDESPDV